MTRAIIVYATMSGNTREVAEMIAKEFPYSRIHDIADTLYVDYEIPNFDLYDVIFFGTYTWDKGSTPDDVKDFILEVGYKPEPMFIFGTGDTQFGGDELFCKAADKLAKFYNSPIPPLKIEQSPRGSQSVLVKEWVRNIKEMID